MTQLINISLTFIRKKRKDSVPTVIRIQLNIQQYIEALQRMWNMRLTGIREGSHVSIHHTFVMIIRLKGSILTCE